MVARPVAQSLDGTMIYDVLDTGRAALPGSGVRPDQTNIEIKFHTDNSYNTTPPEIVVLLCLRPAKSGRRTAGWRAFTPLYNELLARHPELPAAALPAVLVRPPARIPRGRDAGLRGAGIRRGRANCAPASAPTRSAAAMR